MTADTVDEQNSGAYSNEDSGVFSARHSDRSTDVAPGPRHALLATQSSSTAAATEEELQQGAAPAQNGPEYERCYRAGDPSLQPAVRGAPQHPVHAQQHPQQQSQRQQQQKSGHLNHQRHKRSQSSSSNTTGHSDPTSVSVPVSSAGQPWSNTDQWLSQRPLSACLRSIDLTRLPSSSSSRSASPASLLAAAINKVRPVGTPDFAASGRPKRYSPGPGAYSPEVDRHASGLISSSNGSFGRAGRQHTSFIHAHLQTACSPGPAAAGASAARRARTSCGIHSSCSSPRAAGPAQLLFTPRLLHTPGGGWGRADVGTREQPRPKTAPPTTISARSSSPGPDGSDCSSSQKQHSTRYGCYSGSCSRQGERLGPGRYEVAVRRDGSPSRLGGSGSAAWTWSKSPRAVMPSTQPQHVPFISEVHARTETAGVDTPGPQRYQPRHPGVLSDPDGSSACSAGPTLQGKGLDAWTRMEAAAKEVPGCKISGTTWATHKGSQMWPATPSASICPQISQRPAHPFVSEGHSRIDGHSSSRSRTHYAYNPEYVQQDKHVPAPIMESGPRDRFDDKWTSGRLQ